MAESEAAKAYLAIIPKMSESAKASFESDMKKVGKSAGASAGTEGGNAFMGGMKSLIKTAGFAFIASAVKDALGSVVTAFAEYEQVAGGAALLFGDAYDTVMQRADAAAKTVQMSATDYLTTVNGFATGLKEALGGDIQAAADLADGIITAQADIVAATGASADSVANAFAGVMRGNYTMLDNLQMGIQGTQQGMKDVIDKVNELNGTNYQFGNLAEMQQALIDYVDYVGFAGYASEEGASTISGSVATMSASWSNFITKLGNGEDIQKAFEDLVESVKNVVLNIVPVVESIWETLKENVPVWLSDFYQNMLPQITENLVYMVADVVAYILSPDFWSQLANLGMQMILGIAEGLGKGLAQLIAKIPEMFGEWLDGVKEFLGIASPSKVFAGYGSYLMQGLAKGIDESAYMPQAALDNAMRGLRATGLANATVYNRSFTINGMTVRAENYRNANDFTSMLERAAAVYA